MQFVPRIRAGVLELLGTVEVTPLQTVVVIEEVQFVVTSTPCSSRARRSFSMR